MTFQLYERTYWIDQTYRGVQKVAIVENSPAISPGEIALWLDLASRPQVNIGGVTHARPKRHGNRLIIDYLFGKLTLPFTGDMEMDIQSVRSDISGDITHPGSIQTSSGDISLKLFAPLRVLITTESGTPQVEGMKQAGKGIYTPRSIDPIGDLEVKTSSGRIKIANPWGY